METGKGIIPKTAREPSPYEKEVGMLDGATAAMETKVSHLHDRLQKFMRTQSAAEAPTPPEQPPDPISEGVLPIREMRRRIESTTDTISSLLVNLEI